jgi:hypothetical protein
VLATVVVVGIFALAGFAVVCYAAYKLKAESFEFTTVVWKIVSFSIKIASSGKRDELEKK